MSAINPFVPVLADSCAGHICVVCLPEPPPSETPPSDDTGAAFPFTDAVIIINEFEYVTGQRGDTQQFSLGSVHVYSDGSPAWGGFGIWHPWNPPQASDVIIFRALITILHPYYPDGSYNSQLPDITTGPLQGGALTPQQLANNQGFVTTAQNAAIAQANAIFAQGHL